MARVSADIALISDFIQNPPQADRKVRRHIFGQAHDGPPCGILALCAGGRSLVGGAIAPKPMSQ